MNISHQPIQAVRGMPDVIPHESTLWVYLERILMDLVKQYHYQPIRLPLVEKVDLFCRTIGEVTDIVEKEMYVFADRNGENLALRPEGTAGCVRACIENALINRSTQKLWYLGPMFRHERPQKGRYRQFYQFGMEAFGFEGPDIDVEMILFTYRLWQLLGIDHLVTLELNSLGSPEARALYKVALVEYYQAHHDKLDEDSQRRLLSNPLRILDSKNPDIKLLNQDAPKLIDYLDESSRVHFQHLKSMLDTCGIPYHCNPYLVRGLDYYTKTVFEWTTDTLGAQGTICAGGRYDGLVEQLGGQSTPAIGFAMGLERIIAMLAEISFKKHEEPLDIFFITLDPAYQGRALLLCEEMRKWRSDICCYYQPSAGGLKNQMKKADKSGAVLAMILGEEEYRDEKVTLKFLREKSHAQAQLSMDELKTFLSQYTRN